MLTAAYDNNILYYTFFYSLLETGMRKGKAVAIEWKNINFDTNSINIEQTINYNAYTPQWGKKTARD